MAKIATLTPKGTNRKVYVQKVSYSFASYTGVAGTYESNKYIPKGAHILSVEQRAGTAFTSAGAATVALQLYNATTAYTIETATAFDDASYATSQKVATALPDTLVDDSYFIMTIAAAAVTAGVYDWYIRYTL